MAKEDKIQKKQTPLIKALSLSIKILLIVVIVIFALVAYKKFEFSTDTFDFLGKKKSEDPPRVPNQLKWFDDFKGIENVPSEKQQEEKAEKSKNFLQYESQKNKK